jgi:hypothetical protein
VCSYSHVYPECMLFPEYLLCPAWYQVVSVQKMIMFVCFGTSHNDMINPRNKLLYVAGTPMSLGCKTHKSS